MFSVSFNFLFHEAGCEMFDYVMFCIRTFYSRTLFIIFPSKLKRLKQERQELGIEIKRFIDKYTSQVDPEYDKLSHIEEEDLKYKDEEEENKERDLKFLEKRNTLRKIKTDLLKELEFIQNFSNSNLNENENEGYSYLFPTIQTQQSENLDEKEKDNENNEKENLIKKKND